MDDPKENISRKTGLWNHPWFVGISCSIAATLIVTFGGHALSWISTKIVSTISRISHSSIDSAYERAPFYVDGNLAIYLIIMIYASATSIALMVLLEKALEQLVKKMAKKGNIIFFKRSSFLQLYCIAILSSFPVTMVIFSLSSLSHHARITFDQRMMILSPMLSENEKNSIYSDWARLQNKQEFDDIMHRLDISAQAHNIKLPNRIDTQ